MNELKINGTLIKIKKIPTKTGISFTTATLCTSRKDKKTGQWLNSYYNVKSFNTIADEMGAIEEKTKVLIDGYLGQDQYMDEKTGDKRSNTYIMVKSFIIEETKEKTPDKKDEQKTNDFTDSDIPW